MLRDPRIKALASEAAGKIKALTDIHQTQIEAIYQEFREQAAIIQGNEADVTGVKKFICPIGQIKWGDADELETPSVTPNPKSSKLN